jgi:hypothetical protein
MLIQPLPATQKKKNTSSHIQTKYHFMAPYYLPSVTKEDYMKSKSKSIPRLEHPM